MGSIKKQASHAIAELRDPEQETVGEKKKLSLMAEDSGCSEKQHKKHTSSFFSCSPRLFTNLTPKGFHESSETMMSPTSTLDSKPFSGFKNPFWSETNSPRTPVGGGGEHKRYFDKLDSKGVGLGLVDALLVDEKKHGEVNSKPESRTVLFGSQLRIQIPPPLPPPPPPPPATPTFSPSESPIKTRISHLGSSSGSFLSLSPVGKSASGCCANPVLEIETSNSPRVFMGCLSASEMELSEDYTRVISHGPNPRTTHIFDNCIIESSCFELGCSASVSAKENGCFPPHPIISYPSESFLSICFHCKKNLGQGNDIYMYR